MAWWTRELLTYVVYVKAVLHPRTVKWGINTYYLSLGGHTELYHSPTGGGPSNGVKGGNGVVPNGKRLDADLPEKVKANDDISNGVLKSTEYTWRHFPQNGYIRGSMDHQHHLVLMSDA